MNQRTLVKTFVMRPLRTGVLGALALFGLMLSSQAYAQTTYTYTGNPFTLFSCGLAVPGPGTALCSTPGPNSLTSYTATDFVSGTLTFTDPLPASMSLQDVTGLAGFQLTLNDGQHTVTNAITQGLIVQVSTDASGNIASWWIVMNTGYPLNGDISTDNFSNATFGTNVTDNGDLADPGGTVPGNFAYNFNSPGVWTNGAINPATLTTNLIHLINNPLLQLTVGEGSSLTDKLINVQVSIQAGQNKQAKNQLGAFVSSVQTYLKTGKISAQTATTLTNAATAIVALL